MKRPTIFERMSAIARAGPTVPAPAALPPIFACRRGKRRPELPPCRVPSCARSATQASWGCQPHWFKLPPDLRSRLWRVDRDDPGGASWIAAADEADRWIAAHPPNAPRRAGRQRELPF